MNKATRAHTVPKFYLGGFVDPESVGRPDPYVWIGSLRTGKIKQRSPKNISIVKGFYDGPGCFEEGTGSIEIHLAKIEMAAARAIRKFVAGDVVKGAIVDAEIWRFLAWQAARTPEWMALVQEWVKEWSPGMMTPVVEPPPEGLMEIRERARTYCLRDPSNGETIEVSGQVQFQMYRQQGWHWILSSDDRLELIHLQAWYFQVRHFPRLSWTRLNTPGNEWFITSDRAVAWIVDGCADTPPSALRHPTAQVVATLTSTTALVGRLDPNPLQVTPREVNRFVASAASDWVVGPTHAVVERAIEDRLDLLNAELR